MPGVHVPVWGVRGCGQIHCTIPGNTIYPRVIPDEYRFYSIQFTSWVPGPGALCWYTLYLGEGLYGKKIHTLPPTSPQYPICPPGPAGPRYPLRGKGNSTGRWGGLYRGV